MVGTGSRPGVIGASVALLAGVLAVQWLPSLPTWPWVLSLWVMAALTLWRVPRARWIGWCLIGASWAIVRGSMALDAQLPRALEGRDLVVVGRVVDLPEVRPDASGFELRVISAALDGQAVPLRGKLRVAWYAGAPKIEPCTRWRLLLRLKRPRGYLNPGGADAERSALQRGVAATGYVRDDPGNRQIGAAGWCIDGVREHLAQGIDARVANTRDAALLRALAVGDTRALRQRDWQVARANGVSHLIAISGFHVGVAAVFGVVLVMLLYALLPALALRLPRIQAQTLAALVVALLYGALAGMGLPTVRTLLMIAVVVCARYGRRHSGGGQALALAMLAMLIADPLAVLSAGFWLSFVGVAFLMLCLDVRSRGLRGFVRELTAAQAVMTVALLPLTLWFFGVASLVGALSNLVAVPLVSFVIVPLALLSMVLLLTAPAAAAPLLWLAARAVHAQWWLLDHMASWPGAQQFLPAVQPWALLLAMLGALWLLAPRGMPMRWLGALLFLPLLLPPAVRLPERAFEAWVLDVGQGLSVIVRTRSHVLVYDAGARFPPGFDLGEAVVVSSLHALGVRHLDLLMISHGDNDHAGGASAVAHAYPPAASLAGEPERMKLPMSACAAGQHWVWDRVRFSVISPDGPGGKGNDRSCVLLIEGGGDRLLLAGDVTNRLDAKLIQGVPDAAPLVMLVPHHGSKTSSSAALLQALHPHLAVVSAGWRNRFGHPRPEVVERYREAGVPLLNTAEAGAIQLRFPAGTHAQIARRERLDRRRYWRQ